MSTTAADRNLLLEPRHVEFAYEETPRGVWRRHVSEKGEKYAEYTSYAHVFGVPVVHIVKGRNPATLKKPVARGIIAIGQRAVGVVAFGQLSFGVFAFGQAAFGLVFGLGQAATGILAFGQFAFGYFSAGQFAFGVYSAGQMVFAEHGIDMFHVDPQAVKFLRELWPL
jgi:hypothetical protein